MSSPLGEPVIEGLCHANCAYWPEVNLGVLISGVSGSGKSDLTLRLLDRGWQLIADDHVQLIRDGVAIVAMCPDAIVGQMAIAGLGIVNMPYNVRCLIGLSVLLESEPPRFPSDNAQHMICGIAKPCIRINGHSASAPTRVELAMRQIIR